MLSFSQFGSDLDASTKKILAHGAVLMETLKQKQYAPYPMWKQVIELYAVKNRHLDELKVSEVRPYLDGLVSSVESLHHDIIDELTEKKAFDEGLTAKLNAAIEEYVKSR